MKKISLWKGCHGKQIQELIETSWHRNDLLILFPPQLEDLSFLSLLPQGEICKKGIWGSEIIDVKRKGIEYPEDPVLGVFSTGTTGQKLILYSKKNIKSSIEAIFGLYDLSCFESFFCYPQPFHTFGLLLGYVAAFLLKKDLIASSGEYFPTSHRLWSESTSRKLTLGTPAHFKDLMRYTSQLDLQISESYSCIAGGAPVSMGLWQEMQSYLKITSPSIGYGASEASPGITHLLPGKMPLEDGEIGYPLPQISLDVSDSGLWFSGPSVCLAIILNGEIDFPKQVFIGDLLKKRSDGIYIYLGRAELILNRGGEKFSLEEMEKLIFKETGHEAICVGVPDARLGQELGIAYQGPASDRFLLYEILEKSYGRRFNSTGFTVFSKLPLNNSSKVDRHQVRKVIYETACAC